MASSQLLLSLAAAVPAALLSGVLTWAIRPLLVRVALAKPNARSSHRIPTPQGAGIAVIAATLIAPSRSSHLPARPRSKIPVAVFGATLFIAAVGFADDVNSIPVLPRLLLQGLAVAAVILAAPENLRIVPACPLWLERGLLLLAGLWFVNLVNFMDGLDLMTVAEIVPITGAIVLLGWLGEFPRRRRSPPRRCSARCSALRPSTGRWRRSFSATSAACRSACWSAGACCSSPGISKSRPPCCCRSIIWPMRPSRCCGGWQGASRSGRRIARHFYQRATDNGFSVSRVVSEVFALNVVLAALAIGSAMTSSAAIAGLLLVIGGIATALMMCRFSRRQPSSG